MKLGTGLGSALLGWMLEWGGYEGTTAVQSENTIMAMVVTAIILPLVCSAVCFILMLFWDMDKKYPVITEELAKRRAQRK